MYETNDISVMSQNVNQSKPTVYFIEDLEDVTHISEEGFHSLYYFESSLAPKSANQSSIGL